MGDRQARRNAWSVWVDIVGLITAAAIAGAAAGMTASVVFYELWRVTRP